MKELDRLRHNHHLKFKRKGGFVEYWKTFHELSRAEPSIVFSLLNEEKYLHAHPRAALSILDRNRKCWENHSFLEHQIDLCLQVYQQTQTALQQNQISSHQAGERLRLINSAAEKRIFFVANNFIVEGMEEGLAVLDKYIMPIDFFNSVKSNYPAENSQDTSDTATKIFNHMYPFRSFAHDAKEGALKRLRKAKKIRQ